MKPLTQAAIERRALFIRMLELYYLDKRDLTHIARTLGVSGSTTNRWFNDWAAGKLYRDIKKPVLNDSDRQKITTARYL